MRPALLALLLLPGAACVRYVADPIDPVAAARDAPAAPVGPLPYPEAVRFAVEHNPELLALRARARAAGHRPAPAAPELEAGADSDQVFEATLTLDALSLLGMGRQRAENGLARARADEARMRHHERAREIAGEIAGIYAREAALRALELPPIPLDATRWVRAGLAPAAAERLAEAVSMQVEAERGARALERDRDRAALCRLLGAAPGAPVDPEPKEPGWPATPPPDREAILRARADLQRLLAGYEVADGEFRRAVAGQYPAILLRPGVGGDPLGFFGSVAIDLPLGASRAARAAADAREAARFDLVAAVLRALEEAEVSRREHAAAEESLRAARARAGAEAALFRHAETALEAQGGSYLEVLLALRGMVESAAALREASLREASARVGAARAAGWPPS
jgi:outer membrane protein TolC